MYKDMWFVDVYKREIETVRAEKKFFPEIDDFMWIDDTYAIYELDELHETELEAVYAFMDWIDDEVRALGDLQAKLATRGIDLFIEAKKEV